MSAWKETYRAQRGTYSSSTVFPEHSVTETTKALRGTRRLSSVLRRACPPLPKQPVCLFVGASTGTRKQYKKLPCCVAESSSHQEIVRSEKQMLISMWEQQECSGIVKDGIAFSFSTKLSPTLRDPDLSLRCTAFFLSPCSWDQCHPLLLFC